MKKSATRMPTTTPIVVFVLLDASLWRRSPVATCLPAAAAAGEDWEERDLRSGGGIYIQTRQ